MATNTVAENLNSQLGNPSPDEPTSGALVTDMEIVHQESLSNEMERENIKSQQDSLEMERQNLFQLQAELDAQRERLTRNEGIVKSLHDELNSERVRMEAEKAAVQVQQNMYTNDELARRLAALDDLEKSVEIKARDYEKQSEKLERAEHELSAKEDSLSKRMEVLRLTENDVAKKSKLLEEESVRLQQREEQLNKAAAAKQEEFDKWQLDLSAREQALADEKASTSQREATIAQETFETPGGNLVAKKRKTSAEKDKGETVDVSVRIEEIFYDSKDEDDDDSTQDEGHKNEE